MRIPTTAEVKDTKTDTPTIPPCTIELKHDVVRARSLSERAKLNAVFRYHDAIMLDLKSLSNIVEREGANFKSRFMDKYSLDMQKRKKENFIIDLRRKKGVAYEDKTFKQYGLRLKEKFQKDYENWRSLVETLVNNNNLIRGMPAINSIVLTTYTALFDCYFKNVMEGDAENILDINIEETIVRCKISVLLLLEYLKNVLNKYYRNLGLMIETYRRLENSIIYYGSYLFNSISKRERMEELLSQFMDIITQCKFDLKLINDFLTDFKNLSFHSSLRLLRDFFISGGLNSKINFAFPIKESDFDYAIKNWQADEKGNSFLVMFSPIRKVWEIYQKNVNKFAPHKMYTVDLDLPFAYALKSFNRENQDLYDQNYLRCLVFEQCVISFYVIFERENLGAILKNRIRSSGGVLQSLWANLLVEKKLGTQKSSIESLSQISGKDTPSLQAEQTISLDSTRSDDGKVKVDTDPKALITIDTSAEETETMSDQSEKIIIDNEKFIHSAMELFSVIDKVYGKSFNLMSIMTMDSLVRDLLINKFLQSTTEMAQDLIRESCNEMRKLSEKYYDDKKLTQLQQAKKDAKLSKDDGALIDVVLEANTKKGATLSPSPLQPIRDVKASKSVNKSTVFKPTAELTKEDQELLELCGIEP